MSLNIQRIHHITSIAGPVQESYDFYVKFLGLRFVKQTVNFDDRATYHLYFSNQNGDPGTIMTLFNWDMERLGTPGGGQGGRVAFFVPQGTMNDWKAHFQAEDINYEESNLFAEGSIHFQDPHGLTYALVESDEVAETKDILGFYGVELKSKDPQETRKGLLQDLGMKELSGTDTYYRFETLGEEKHQILVNKEGIERGKDGVGIVHHVAWMVPDSSLIDEYRDSLKEAGYRPTSMKDRKYFKSIYMRERGRVLYEFASSDPGFEVDESPETLGQSLQLPAQYEQYREEIVEQLDPIEL